MPIDPERLRAAKAALAARGGKPSLLAREEAREAERMLREEEPNQEEGVDTELNRRIKGDRNKGWQI